MAKRQNALGYRKSPKARKKDVAPPERKPIRIPKRRGRKPKDGSTGVKIKFDPVDILNRMNLDPSDSRYILPISVSKNTRNYLVYFATHSLQMSRLDIARLFDITPTTVAKILSDTQSELIDVPAETAVERLSIDILDRMDALSRKAVEKGKPYDAWKIRKEAIELLQSLGVTFKKPEEHRIIEEWEFPNLSGDVELEEETSVRIKVKPHEGNGHSSKGGN